MRIVSGLIGRFQRNGADFQNGCLNNRAVSITVCGASYGNVLFACGRGIESFNLNRTVAKFVLGKSLSVVCCDFYDTLVEVKLFAYKVISVLTCNLHSGNDSYGVLSDFFLVSYCKFLIAELTLVISFYNHSFCI